MTGKIFNVLFLPKPKPTGAGTGGETGGKPQHYLPYVLLIVGFLVMMALAFNAGKMTQSDMSQNYQQTQTDVNIPNSAPPSGSGGNQLDGGIVSAQYPDSDGVQGKNRLKSVWEATSQQDRFPVLDVAQDGLIYNDGKIQINAEYYYQPSTFLKLNIKNNGIKEEKIAIIIKDMNKDRENWPAFPKSGGNPIKGQTTRILTINGQSNQDLNIGFAAILRKFSISVQYI